MNKWLKIGGIAGAAVLLTVIVALVTVMFMPTPASARLGSLAGRSFGMAQVGDDFPGQFGPKGRGGFGNMGGFQGGPGGFGDMGGFRGGPGGFFGGNIDRQTLLADALGITVDELDAAVEKADLAGVQQALADGWLGQNQADLMTAQIKLRNYMDHNAMLAEALGVTAEELQAARADGQSMRTLLDEKGLDSADVATAMQTAFQEQLDKAVADGVITQAQADLLQNQGGMFGRGFGKGGPGGFGGGPRGMAGPHW
jgi:lambda repressor-like predicted transcriptional regulator